MVRKLTIEIIGFEWFIQDYSVNTDDFEYLEDLNDKPSFPTLDKGKNCGLCYMFNYTLPERQIKAAKEAGGLFNEVCLFTHGGHTFGGDFIDALLYIKNKLNEMEKENG
jgi:hypothetical protein